MMLRNIRIVPNLSKVLVAVLVVATIPWLCTKYHLWGPHLNHRPQSMALDSRSESSKTDKPALLQLPAVAEAQPLHRTAPAPSTVLTSGYPADQAANDRGLNDLPLEPGLTENGPILNGPAQENPLQEQLSTQPTSEIEYPTTAIRTPEESYSMGVDSSSSAEPTEQGWGTVSSPAASKNHGSVSTEAAITHPAVQTTVMPIGPERTPVQGELSGPSNEPIGSRPMPQAAASPVRSEQLESIARQADGEIRHGFELAGRGAYYAARSEFIAALRVVAQGLDNDRQTTIHGKSLAAGLTALREAEEFIPRGSMIEANLDVPALVVGHVTPVLKNSDTSRITPIAAMKSYLTFAQEELAASVETEYAGSMALRALGKLHDELAARKNDAFPAASQKAVVFYQSALIVAPNNFMAANDLGVMLAKAGNLNDARTILEHSAAVGRQSTVLNNLATVYQRLGYQELAKNTQQQSLVAQREEKTRQATGVRLAANGSVEWVAPETFAQNSPNPTTPTATAMNPTVSPTTKNTIRAVAPSKPAEKSFGSYNPHWSPNYRQQKPEQDMLGQAQKNDYQR